MTIFCFNSNWSGHVFVVCQYLLISTVFDLCHNGSCERFTSSANCGIIESDMASAGMMAS